MTILSPIRSDKTLIIDEYPQLTLLAWNRTLREIEPEDAFALYERNWRFVDVTILTAKERALIKRLTRDYGHGVMNV
jgi:hypothetical protein